AWLVGMSVSPVVQVLVTALTSLVVMAVGLFSQPEMPPADKGASPEGAPPEAARTEAPPPEAATALPFGVHLQPSIIATLIFGIALGAILGLMTRTSNW